MWLRLLARRTQANTKVVVGAGARRIEPVAERPPEKSYRIFPTYRFNWILSISQVTEVNPHHLLVLSLCHLMDTHVERLLKRDVAHFDFLASRLIRISPIVNAPVGINLNSTPMEPADSGNLMSSTLVATTAIGELGCPKSHPHNTTNRKFMKMRVRPSD